MTNVRIKKPTTPASMGLIWILILVIVTGALVAFALEVTKTKVAPARNEDTASAFLPTKQDQLLRRGGRTYANKMGFTMASDETMNSSRSANLSSRLRDNYFLAFVDLCFLSAQGGAYATGARTLSPPDAVMNVLSRALNSHYTKELVDKFDPGTKDIKASDPVQGQNELSAFTQGLDKSIHPSREEDSRFILEVGQNRWPVAILIVRNSNPRILSTDEKGA